MKHTKKYLDYLNSLEWYVQREAALERASGRCQRCGAHEQTCVLQVHHLTYERLGCEKPEDLRVLCKPCHEIEDGERRVRVARQNAARLYEARLDGWANKVYGENWSDYKDPNEVAEDFDRWVERRGDDGY